MSRWKLSERDLAASTQAEDLSSTPAESHLAPKVERRGQRFCCPGQEELRQLLTSKCPGKSWYKLNCVDPQDCYSFHLKSIIFIFFSFGCFFWAFLCEWQNKTSSKQPNKSRHFQTSTTSLYPKQSSLFLFLQKVWRAEWVSNILVVPQQIKVQQQPLGSHTSENLLCCYITGGERPKIRTFPLGLYEKKSRTFPLAQVYFRKSREKLFYL